MLGDHIDILGSKMVNEAVGRIGASSAVPLVAFLSTLTPSPPQLPAAATSLKTTSSPTSSATRSAWTGIGFSLTTIWRPSPRRT